MTSIAERYGQVVETINRACSDANREPADVKLVVVTKKQPAQQIIEAYVAGARLFGENYPEETENKIDELKDQIDPEWHMIGHIQSRKTKLVARHFSCVHSVDRLEIAQRLDSECHSIGRVMPVFLEVNISGEESKFGFQARNPAQVDDFLCVCETIRSCSNLELIGLMTMPPILNRDDNRKVFEKCRILLTMIQARVGISSMTELSMGTSYDFKEAIKEGATHIRIGEAIMGERK